MGKTIWKNSPVRGWDPAWSELSGFRTTHDKITTRFDGLRVLADGYENQDDPRPDTRKIANFTDPTPIIDPLPRPYERGPAVHPISYLEDRDHFSISITAGTGAVRVLALENLIALGPGNQFGISDEINIHENPARASSVSLTVPTYTGGAYLYLATISPVQVNHIDMMLGVEALGAWDQVTNPLSVGLTTRVLERHLGVNTTQDFNIWRTTNELSDEFSGNTLQVGAHA